MNKNRNLSWMIGIVVSLCFIFILLISSIQVGAYGNFGFYEKEYAKYDVLKDVNMEMPDVMYVTREMMVFLKGERENLIVDTVVDGKERAFFNEKEIAHMEDVQYLFVKGLEFRISAIIILLVVLLVGRLAKVPLRQVLPKAFQYTTLGLFVITAGLVGIIATDFTKYFTKFHEIFFNNDLWLLDPNTDLLINILPEGFFMDMAGRIGIIFGVLLVVSFIVATLIRRANK